MVAGIIAKTIALPCDGCGQTASSEHIGRRLQRLEWTTRFRPVHIHTLLLSGISPREDKEFLYAPRGEFYGEARLIMEAAGIPAKNKTREVALAEFQRAGFFLTHVLECPVEEEPMEATGLLEHQLPAALVRIRRSLKPKRLVLISSALEGWIDKIAKALTACAVILDNGKPFALDSSEADEIAARLRQALQKTSAT